MGATVSTAQAPLLPEYMPMKKSPQRSNLRPSTKNMPAFGTLLCGVSVPAKERPGKMQISLHGGDLRQTVDSDLSTTANTSRSEDYDSDGYPEATPVAQAGLACVPHPMGNEVRVIILDWDDTLLPTGFLRDCLKMYPACRPAPVAGRRLNSKCPGQVARPGRTGNGGGLGSGFPCQAALEQHASLVREVLCAARSVAQVAIVTLAERPWVLESAEQFLPSLSLPQLLSDLDIPVYYASEYRRTASGVDLPAVVSKRMAMDAYLQSLNLKLESTRLNLLSVGDSMAERDAARQALGAMERQAAAAKSPSPICKTIKFQTDPPLKMLTFELGALLRCLGRMVALSQGFDVLLEQSDGLDDVDDKMLRTIGA